MFYVKLFPKTGEDTGHPKVLVDFYSHHTRKKVDRCLTEERLIRGRKKKYRIVELPTVPEARQAVEEFLTRLRKKDPKLREFDIEFPHFTHTEH
jgi:hypothetical protein